MEYHFWIQRTQQFSGIDSDLAKELAKDLKVELEFIPKFFATLINDVKNSSCHIAMFAIGNTEAKKRKIKILQQLTYQVMFMLITTKNNKRIQNWDDIDKKGNVIAVAKGTTHEPVMKEKLKMLSFILIKMHQREEEVQAAGRADVFMTDYPFAKKEC